MRFIFGAQMAWHGVAVNPLRSGLTMLGVAIGVASVISLMGIGEGARLAVVRQFESLGSNVIVIKAHDAKAEFQPEEARELVERVSGLRYASPVTRTNAVMKWRRARGQVDILGVSSDFPQLRDHKLVSGRFFTPWHVEQRSPVAVLGYNIGAGLLGGRSPVGQTVTLNGQTFRIVGVLEKKGEGQGEGIDDKIIIPYTTAMKIAGKRTVDEIWVKAESAKAADLAIAQLGRIYRRKLGLDNKAPVPTGGEQKQGETPGEGPGTGKPVEPKPAPAPETPGKDSTPGLELGKDIITITNLNTLVEEADKANRVMTLLLGGIAAVSLLVGGLGIMNIMLVAVTERTGEIGVRRALGAKRSDLLMQFLLEALYLSGMGAAAGTAAGLWGVGIFNRYGLTAVVSLEAVKVAVLVALGCGLLFGVYPAWTAASVPPVEALRR
ncbi:putative ABC transport system permease protein [Thermosediminibacter litoriperuensis]|uniref:Putative ABC transport system permease protein n=1 Tax=Thermosediminibacter litoriperuensis TaxID=291989 RepID=A0A5S5AM81_9FIRM|nr:putative ABC transport system permease protein [Thermosediminibacter litoriperuensis]